MNRGLDAYNRTKIGDYTYLRLDIFAYDTPERETLMGGVFGDLIWVWLHIDSLWVDEAYRGRGVGVALMRHAEEMDRAQGVVNSTGRRPASRRCLLLQAGLQGL